MNLRSHGNKLAPLHKGRTIIEATEHPERKPHRNHGVAISKSLRNFQKGFQALLKQQLLMKEIAASISRNAKFREYDESGFILDSLGSTTDYFIRVKGRIGNLEGWANRCESVKSKHDLNIALFMHKP